MSFFNGLIISYCIVLLLTMSIAVVERRRPKLVALAFGVFLLTSLYVAGVIIDVGVV